MDALIQILSAAAVLCAVLYAVPRIKEIPPTIQMVIIVAAVLATVLYVLRYALPRVT